MDYYLRCNSLPCRIQLKEKAVVTTCSHIFCLACADTLGLSHQPSSGRQCPACQHTLVNPDDVASTILTPTEDYKASILSGLDPTTIMECAGRALMFWSYQATQEVFYQDFLAKKLTDKYSFLSKQTDKVVHNANTEIKSLQVKVLDMQKTQRQLQEKNNELFQMYRDKSKKHAQMTNLYNLLKSRTMKSQMQTAASKSVSQALDSLEPRNEPPTPAHGSMGQVPQTPSNGFPVSKEGIELLHRYQRSGTGSSSGKKKLDRKTMPPPSRPTGIVKSTPTPRHRTRLPGPARPSTGTANLPHGDALFERFQNTSFPDGVPDISYFTDPKNGFVEQTRTPNHGIGHPHRMV